MILFGGLEVAVRVMWSVKTGNAQWLTYGWREIIKVFRFDVDYYPGYLKLNPGTVTSEGDTINRHGFRGKDFSLKKPSGVYRIVVVGGSAAYGADRRLPITFPYLLEQQLNNALGRSCVEVINADMPTMATAEVAVLVDKEVIGWEPDLIIVYSLWNHLFRDVLQYRRKVPLVGPVLHFLSGNFSHRSVAILVLTERLAFRGPTAYFNKVEAYRGALQDIIQSAQAAGVAVLLVKQLIRSDGVPGALPSSVRRVEQLDWTDDALSTYRQCLKVVEDLGRQHNLPIVDFSLFSFKDYRQEENRLLFDRVHLDDEGHQALAKRLFSTIATLASIRANCS